MASAVTTTTFADMLKTLYPAGVPENVASRNRVLLSKLAKKDGFTGANMAVPIWYGNPMARSASLSTAVTRSTNTNIAPAKSEQWVVTRAKDYAVTTIDAEAIMASRDNPGAFVEARKSQIDMMLDQLGHSASIACYGSGSGSIGRRSSLSSNTITLTVPADAKNFSVGMSLVAGPNDSASGLRTNSAVVYVTAVDLDAGTVTVNDASLVGSFADNDYLFPEGDPGVKMKGLAGWLPLTAPTAGDSFFSVDRSVDTVRLAGNRLDNSSAPISENLLTLAEKCVMVGGRPDAAYLNHTNFSTLVKELGSKVVYNDGGGKAGVGFRGVEIYTSAGVLTVFPDPDCPSNRGYVLQMDTWKLHHLGGFPHLVMDDGNNAIRQASDDGIEVRARYYGQLVCTAPAFNGVMSI